jgi:hypothetical protein
MPPKRSSSSKTQEQQPKPKRGVGRPRKGMEKPKRGVGRPKKMASPTGSRDPQLAELKKAVARQKEINKYKGLMHSDTGSGSGRAPVTDFSKPRTETLSRYLADNYQNTTFPPSSITRTGALTLAAPPSSDAAYEAMKLRVEAKDQQLQLQKQQQKQQQKQAQAQNQLQAQITDIKTSSVQQQSNNQSTNVHIFTKKVASEKLRIEFIAEKISIAKNEVKHAKQDGNPDKIAAAQNRLRLLYDDLEDTEDAVTKLQKEAAKITNIPVETLELSNLEHDINRSPVKIRSYLKEFLKRYIATEGNKVNIFFMRDIVDISIDYYAMALDTHLSKEEILDLLNPLMDVLKHPPSNFLKTNPDVKELHQKMMELKDQIGDEDDDLSEDDDDEDEIWDERPAESILPPEPPLPRDAEDIRVVEEGGREADEMVSGTIDGSGLGSTPYFLGGRRSIPQFSQFMHQGAVSLFRPRVYGGEISFIDGVANPNATTTTTTSPDDGNEDPLENDKDVDVEDYELEKPKTGTDKPFRPSAFTEELPKNMPPEIRKLVEKWGDATIIKARICRVPLAGILQKLGNLVTLGNLQKQRVKLGYENLFHLYIEVALQQPDGTKGVFKIEKNEKAQYKATSGGVTQKDAVCMNQPPTKKTTLLEAIKRAEKAVGGEKLWVYNLNGQNCQDFAVALLGNGNGMLTAAGKTFAMQSPAKLLPGLLLKVIGNVTNLANKVKSFLKGKGLPHDPSEGLPIMPIADVVS